jgi:hypothetical protein
MRSTCARTSTAPGWSLRELGAAIMASNPFATPADAGNFAMPAHAGNAPAVESVRGHGADPPHADVAMLAYQSNSSQANCRLGELSVACPPRHTAMAESAPAE